MRNTIRLLAAGLLIAGLSGAASARETKGKGSEAPTCGSYGTSVQFEKSPSDAARRAVKEEKLVMVLHVSGHFEDSEFT